MCQPPVAAAWANPETMTPVSAAMTPAKSTQARRVMEAEIAIEERGDEKARGGGGEVGVVERGKSSDGRRVETGPEESEKTGEADAAGGDGERRGEADLPDVEKTEPVAGAFGAVDFLEEGVAAASAREGCAELGPDEAVGDGDDGAEHPRPDGEPIASGGDDERQSDEGADADHLEHVEEDGGAKADAALRAVRWRDVGDRGFGSTMLR